MKKAQNPLQTKNKLFNIGYKILNINGEQIYVLGIKKILKFSPEQVMLLLKNGKKLILCGINIIICESSSGAIMLGGAINKIEVDESA